MFKYAGGKDSNRAFVCSADLLCEHPTEPWSRLASPPDTVLRAVCDWMKEFKGAHDFIVLFDGRSKEILFRLHTHMAGRAHGTQLLLLYTGRNTTQLGQRRKVALSAQNVESVLVYSPFSRTLISTKPRSSFNALGETSTHDTTYSGITFRARGGIPRLSEKDKKAIIGDHSPCIVPEALAPTFGANPILFWQEAKPISLLEALLEDLDIAAVFDVSPGSGALAEACLRLGVQYVGVTTSDTHNRWLQNVLDRAAVEHIVTQGRPLYQRSLVEHVRRHFDEVLSALDAARAAADVDIEELISAE